MPTSHPTRQYRFGDITYEFPGPTRIMGILNVTPDSFSDGGRYLDADRAIDHGLAMVAEGADVIDVGGESTRPRGKAYGAGAVAVDVEQELLRVIPVIRGLARQVRVPISIDTTKAAVAREALNAGASIVNDISGFHFDPALAHVAGEARATAVLMHTRGTPETMQHNLHYDDLFGEITAYLREGIARGHEEGVTQMFVDPGIGFGKSVQQNLQLIAGLRRFEVLGYPVLVGPSRKAFIGAILDLPVEDRLEGTLAAIAAAIMSGVAMVRVHDVRAAVRVARITDAIRDAGAAL